jgi:acyl-CoA dehydrogenase
MTDINPRSRDYQEYRQAIRALCADFGGEYWQSLEADAAYPEAFVKALTDAGWLAALIPEEFGGGGLGVTEASVILEEINRSGANSGACHAQMYIMGTLLRHGSDAQKRQYLPDIAAGSLRLQSFAVTEPTTGTDTTKTRTTAVRTGDRYVVNGQKVWISRIQHSDLMLLLARTTPLAEVVKKTEGLSIFLVDLRGAEQKGMTVRPIHNKRILIAAECIGDGFWFIDRARRYAGERVVFDRPIGKNQGIQFPLARAYANVRAADLMRYEAARLFDAGQPAGGEANMAKMLAADASWEAANACLQTFGGFGFAEEYDIERKFRETRLYQVAPISTNLILSYIGEHILGMPRSF